MLSAPFLIYFHNIPINDARKLHKLVSPNFVPMTRRGKGISEYSVSLVLRGNRSFFFLFDGFDETRTKNDGFTCYFGVRTWNLWWFHWNQVFFGGVEAVGLSFTKKTCVSMNTTTGFQVLISKVTCEYHHFFVRVSLNTVNKIKKNMSAFPLKLFISHWRPNFCPWIASNFSKYCFNIFPKKKKNSWNHSWNHKQSVRNQKYPATVWSTWKKFGLLKIILPGYFWYMFFCGI